MSTRGATQCPEPSASPGKFHLELLDYLSNLHQEHGQGFPKSSNSVFPEEEMLVGFRTFLNMDFPAHGTIPSLGQQNLLPCFPFLQSSPKALISFENVSDKPKQVLILERRLI